MLRTDNGHVLFVTQHTVFCDVRRCQRSRCGQTRAFSRMITCVNIFQCVDHEKMQSLRERRRRSFMVSTSFHATLERQEPRPKKSLARMLQRQHGAGKLCQPWDLIADHIFGFSSCSPNFINFAVALSSAHFGQDRLNMWSICREGFLWLVGSHW